MSDYPSMSHVQHITFEGNDCVVMSPEEYGAALADLEAKDYELSALRAENARVYEEGVSRLIEAQKINNREIESLRADLNAAKTALENQIAHTTEIANLCARQRAWIDGVMAQKVVDAVDIGAACANLRMVDTRHREIDDALHDIEVRSVKAILRPAPFEDK